jgi:hypothetical protein
MARDMSMRDTMVTGAKVRFGSNPTNADDHSNKMTLDWQDSRF